MTRDPQTPAEWREAVAWAEVGLLLDSARHYGLITGGPTVDAERCDEILKRAKAMGLAPTDEDTYAAMRALISG